MQFLDATITIPLSTLVLIAAAMLLAALAEIAGHYYFHPHLRHPLGKLAAYTYGSLAWTIPLFIVFILHDDWVYIPVTLLILGSAGLATWWANHKDGDDDLAGRCRSAEAINHELEREAGVGHDVGLIFPDRPRREGAPGNDPHD
jgi:hypothetical protein